MTMTLLHGDCLKLMPDLPVGSIDMICCDPPYGTINGMGGGGVVHGMKNKTSWDKVIDHSNLLASWERVLRPNGVLTVFSQGQYTIELLTNTHSNLPLSYRLIWLKDHFANSLVAKKAPLSYFEEICVFFKKYDKLNQHPLRVYSKKILRFCKKTLGQINSDMGHRRAEHFFYTDSTQFGICTRETYEALTQRYNLKLMLGFMTFDEILEIDRRFSRRFNLPKGRRHKSNVLEYKKDYTGMHPTQKPIKLIEDLIKTYTNEGDTVLDNCMGSGTTGVACKNLGRKFIGIELDDKYFNIAKERIAQQGDR